MPEPSSSPLPPVGARPALCGHALSLWRGL